MLFRSYGQTDANNYTKMVAYRDVAISFPIPITTTRQMRSTYDAFAGFEAFKHFVILRILPADPDFAAVSLFPVLIEHKNPVSARTLKERTLRDDDAFGGLSELKIDVVCLPASDIVGAFAGKDKVRAEFTV